MLSPPDAPAFKERRKDTRKRDIVARGIHAGRDNVLIGVEYLQSRGIEARIIRRVLLRLWSRRPPVQETDRAGSLN